jgi:hypothetical protein
MRLSPVSAAGALTRAWTRVYTCGLPPDERRSRQAEIESDVWELQHDAAESRTDSRRTGLLMLARLLLGLPYDVVWRLEQLTLEEPLSWLKPAITLVSFALASTLVIAAHPAVDLERGLRVDVLALGWLQIGGLRPRLVPAVSFRLKNVSEQTLHTLQVNALFGREKHEGLGTAYAIVAGSRGVAPGETTKALLLKAQSGYTDNDPDRLRPGAVFRLLQLDDSTMVTLFAKHESHSWTRLGEYRIAPGHLASEYKR